MLPLQGTDSVLGELRSCKLHRGAKRKKKDKIPTINLTEEVKDLCTEDCKIWMKLKTQMERYSMLKDWKNQYC